MAFGKGSKGKLYEGKVRRKDLALTGRTPKPQYKEPNCFVPGLRKGMRDETRERDGMKVERTFLKRIKLVGRGNTIYNELHSYEF